MKTVKIKTYSAAELKENFPEGFERALTDNRNSVNESGAFWTDEIIDSLKGLFSAASIDLKNYSIGAYSYSSLDFEMEEETGLLFGARAGAWLENNLLAGLRVPFSGPGRWKNAKYGVYYRPGLIKPCPFTGVCFDENFLNCLREDIRGGMNLKDSFRALADRAAKIMEEEHEEQSTEEYFLDAAEANDWNFRESGEMFNG